MAKSTPITTEFESPEGGLGLTPEELRRLAEILAPYLGGGAAAGMGAGGAGEGGFGDLGSILAAGSLAPAPREPSFAQFVDPMANSGIPQQFAPHGLGGGVSFLGGSLTNPNTPLMAASTLALLTNLAEGITVAKDRIDEGRARREREKKQSSGSP